MAVTLAGDRRRSRARESRRPGVARIANACKYPGPRPHHQLGGPAAVWRRARPDDRPSVSPVGWGIGFRHR